MTTADTSSAFRGDEREGLESSAASSGGSASRGKLEYPITERNARQVMDALLRMMAQWQQEAESGKGGAKAPKATDLHINPGRPPDFRVERVIRSLKFPKLTAEDVVLLSNAIMNENQRKRFENNHCIDMSYHVDNVRFRVNIVQAFTGRSISFRRFEAIKDFSAYHLPPNYISIAEGEHGFVIMSGSTGSGKTTSIAAMLDHLNRNFQLKICTIEDPIEYVYQPKKSIIVQIEIGEDGIPNEDIALRNLVRMDPDAGLAGEMRDRQSLEAALKTAQAGHLIYGTLHCEGVGQAFDRILAYYDTIEQQRILGTLADNLAAIINQRLLPCIRPGVDVIPAYEIFIPNPLTRRYIREMRYQEAVAEMEKPAMKELGCVTYVDSLYKLVTEEWIKYDVALENAGDKAEKLKARLKGIDMK
ncbi:MAG: type IV pilus twitching motility protein PilT [Phycisphaerae bacterium]